VKHFSAEQKAATIANYPVHERKARAYGVPMLGSGAIFTFPEELISEAAIKHIPTYWAKLWGIDFGIGHPFAAVLVLWDRDNDCVHVHHAVRMLSSDSQLLLPINHAAALKRVGAAVPVAWPQDGTAREKSSGDPLAAIYRREGLKMLPEPAMWPEGGNSTEAGIREMEARFATNRLKIASHLSEWFEEYRSYHRDKGQIVKLNDDLLSATRVAIMALRYARPVGLGSNPVDNRIQPVTQAEGWNFDPHLVEDFQA
jgi:Terminase RNaseH-like domain